MGVIETSPGRSSWLGHWTRRSGIIHPTSTSQVLLTPSFTQSPNSLNKMVQIDDDFSDPDDLDLSLDSAPPLPPPSAQAHAQAKKSHQLQGLSNSPYKQMEPHQYKQ